MIFFRYNIYYRCILKMSIFPGYSKIPFPFSLLFDPCLSFFLFLSLLISKDHSETSEQPWAVTAVVKEARVANDLINCDLESVLSRALISMRDTHLLAQWEGKDDSIPQESIWEQACFNPTRETSFRRSLV